MLDLANHGIEKVHHGFNDLTEGLVDIHEDGDMPYRLRHGTKTRSSI